MMEVEVVLLHPFFWDKGCVLCVLFYFNFYGTFVQREMKEFLED